MGELLEAGLAVVFGCFSILLLTVIYEVAREGPEGIRRARLEKRYRERRQP